MIEWQGFSCQGAKPRGLTAFPIPSGVKKKDARYPLKNVFEEG
jgi:hypothetical protein